MLETPARPAQNGHQPAPVRRAGLVVRVSTDRQASNPEGSLKTQLERLRQHVEYKRAVAGEDWTEVEVYELKAVSGKDSMRSAEFQRLFADIRSGRINTILCTALDRICRSVKDFLHFFEVLNDHGVEFVCLKQNYDTTTPQGRLFVMIMMALAQFEREQTSERTSEATAARAERGLWNGGRLLGYDLDANHKGYLIPNADEVALVNFAYDTYLTCGSIAETMKTLNARGYRTKVFESRRGKVHTGEPFSIPSVQFLLKNPAYVGKKIIKKGGRRLVDAVWPGIVDEEKFERAQRLMAANTRTGHNGMRAVRHAYVLSGNLLHCGRCASAMEGTSGTGRGGVKYFYYVCGNGDCGLRVGADEIEQAVISRVQELAASDGLLGRIVEETNKRMARQRPALLARRRSMQKGLADVKADADKVLGEWSAMEADAVRGFLADKLSGLAQRRDDLERGLSEVGDALARLDQAEVTAATVREALGRFGEAYACLAPFEKKELVRLVLHRAEVADRQIVLELYPIQGRQVASRSPSRPGTLDWLPE